MRAAARDGAPCLACSHRLACAAPRRRPRARRSALARAHEGAACACSTLTRGVCRRAERGPVSAGLHGVRTAAGPAPSALGRRTRLAARSGCAQRLRPRVFARNPRLRLAGVAGVGRWNVMTTPDESASLTLGIAAAKLMEKNHFARAAEKFGAAADAAVQELAADDCLVVTFLRTWQASCIFCHSGVPTLSPAENADLVQTACDLLLPCISTLTRRKEAGTLLPGSCRPAEVAWFRPFVQGHLDPGLPADQVHAFAHASAVVAGSELYFMAASVSRDLALQTEGRLPSLVAFVASALDLLAIQPREPPVVKGKVAGVCVHETALAANVRCFFQSEYLKSRLGAVGTKLLTDAWQRVEHSGVLERRLLGRASLPDDPSQSVSALLKAAAAEGAAHGLHTCALPGCAATEVHVSQFKKCGACLAAWYCCKEHQVEDWPSHKAACKAAAPGDDDS